MSKMSSNKQSPRNSSYDRGSLLVKGLRANKNRFQVKNTDLKHSRSNSAADHIQIRGLNQAASMPNIIAKGNSKPNEHRASLKKLKENPNQP